ncbi:uncharacterized protein DUF1488 [Mycetohabitans endofungorum]|uniref:Uncharacterized protein DUF1488 n=2 Tax=Burkholderiaceae TaxID=119060 RepID=A0A2P5KCB2_9BURK|nr:uncharacterized protein DUF1488 [Mycetohabitans endofungorum]
MLLAQKRGMNVPPKTSSHINFEDAPPSFDGARMMLDFTASVDGRLVRCSVSAEALEDHFGAASALESELLQAFERGRNRIHRVARLALEDSDGQPVVLHSGLFRISAT